MSIGCRTARPGMIDASLVPMFHPIELLNEWATRTNRPVRPQFDVAQLASLWNVVGHESVTSALRPLELGPLPLMVVVTTHGRANSFEHVLIRLGESLRAAGVDRQASLLVLRDACQSDYSRARELAASVAGRTVWLDARERFGKAGFWKVHQTALLVARAWQPARALYLQDDVDFDADLLMRAEAIWQATASDPLRRVLYLCSAKDDEEKGRWARFPRQELPHADCRLTNWFDLQAFFVDAAFFSLLKHSMVPVHPNRWLRQPSLSSGVGRQFTLRLQGRASIYQATPTLVRHGGQSSLMNPEARAARALDNRAEHEAGSRSRDVPTRYQ